MTSYDEERGRAIIHPASGGSRMAASWLSDEARKAYDTWISMIEAEHAKARALLNPNTSAATAIALPQNPEKVLRNLQAVTEPMKSQAADLYARYTVPGPVMWTIPHERQRP